jgi:hypothetical protein
MVQKLSAHSQDRLSAAKPDVNGTEIEIEIGIAIAIAIDTT